jgi:hypothetical protein
MPGIQRGQPGSLRVAQQVAEEQGGCEAIVPAVGMKEVI